MMGSTMETAAMGDRGTRIVGEGARGLGSFHKSGSRMLRESGLFCDILSDSGFLDYSVS